MKLAEAIRRHCCDKVPLGWLTAEQMAKRDGYPYCTGHYFYLLKSAVRRKIISSRVFRMATRSGLRSKTHYRRIK